MHNIKTRAPLEIQRRRFCFYYLHFINVWQGKGVRAIKMFGRPTLCPIPYREIQKLSCVV